MKHRFFPALCLAGLFAFSANLIAAEPVDYTKQIKPLLLEFCVDCHGIDDQRSGLRMDAAKLVVTGGDRGAAVIPGKSEKSLLYTVLLGKGKIPRMPAEMPPLSKEQISLIKRWIDEGAKFPKDEVIQPLKTETDHWAFQPITRPSVPNVKNRAWIHNAIDAFVLARLEKEGLKPSAEADRMTLIRRLSFDLRGLPPTIEEVDAFLADERPAAYERLVDRMLASPHYGERWGRHWLDLARYADSNGFTIDGARSIWKYRDWVISAFNRDLPFDQFTIEQLAGDMLPHATTDQIIATGLHRNTLINQEGGTSPEQFRVEAVVDRVNTTGAVFLGLTVGCGRCHAHKFDPLTQREFYQMFAVFNNCDDRNSENRASLVPMLSVPSKGQTAKLKQLNTAIVSAEKPLNEHDRKFLNGLPEWSKKLAEMPDASAADIWSIPAAVEFHGEKGAQLNLQKDKSLYVDFSAPPQDTFVVVLETPSDKITAIRLEALTHPNLPKNGPGYGDNGKFMLTGFEVEVAPLNEPDKRTSVKISNAVADHSQEGYPVTDTLDGKNNTGWAIGVKKGNMNVDREAVFFPEKPIENANGSRLTVKMHHLSSSQKYLIGHFRLALSSAPVETLSVPAAVRKIAAVPAEKRSKAQQAQLEGAYKATDEKRGPLATKVTGLRKQRETLIKAIPTTLIMKERKVPREAHIMLRGDFLRKGARVYGGVPAFLPPLPQGVTDANRLDFARWLVDPQNPLTSRVTVNRFWQRFFGTGIVFTENDFGLQGAIPTHPKLLDWLSSEFIRLDWGIKAFHRLIVTSATYRQSSHVSEELLKRDPRNRWLARQSRLRLEAEVIRDVTMAASGLLSQKMFGAGVYPPQPQGIYVLTQIKKAWPESQGDDRYRRGLYTYFWRSSPYPFLPTFDASDANSTCTQRSRSNTPLQALTLANDRAFYEFAQSLATRILREGPHYNEGRIRYAFRVCFSREPNNIELKRLGDFVEKTRKAFEAEKDRALQVAPAERPAGVSTAEAATWTAFARVLLNLDEFITRE